MTNPMSQFLQQSQPQKATANNPLAMIFEFRKFAAGMTPEGAKRQVEQMLSSGQMTQEQFQQLKRQAAAFSELLK
nr:MAG TPA: Short C-terminal domain [Caudoviricetes sp.]